VLVLIGLPALVSAWPVRQSGISADDLLSRINHSQRAAYSGFAESSGGLALPVTRQLSSVADLFGDSTQMRVWWRSAQDWRIDTITFAGESDVHASPRGSWTWDYEANRATFLGQGLPAEVRLPTSGDLLPTNLARRLLSAATPAEVSRLSARRVAGRSAPGLRLTPNPPQSTIGHVDVWADLATGLPMRVDVYGKGSSSSVLSSKFLDFSTRTPRAADVGFTLPQDAHVRILNQPDLAAAIDQLSAITPPAELGGLARSQSAPSLGAIGVYGVGVTEFAAAPLPDQIADALRNQLAGAARKTPAGLETTIGPLSLLLTSPDEFGESWLLTGTVTLQTLERAATQLPLADGIR
jgi:hypothetical protein